MTVKPNRVLSNSYTWWIMIALFCAIFLFQPGLALEEIVCGGFDMRNSPAYFIDTHGKSAIEEWQNCTVIEGDVRYILMTNTAKEKLTKEDFVAVQLPNVREITGSLMVFQVAVLESLDLLLPNLRVIRGNSLVFNYAFVLFQNPELKEIGLTKLTEISKGGVRIASNSALCYANTINWTEICRDEVTHFVVENNQDANNCADKCRNNSSHCSQIKGPSITEISAPTFHCWNYDSCQAVCPFSCTSKGLSCDLTQNPPICCHKECVGGCIGPSSNDCYACRHVNVDGRCEKRCPAGLFTIQGRRCITERECRKRKPVTDEYGEVSYYKPLQNGVCDTKCPAGYNVNPNDPRRCIECAYKNKCVKKCNGGGSITNLAEAEAYKGCNVITGHLEINIQSGLTKNVAQELENYLGDIREVMDYVKISFSPSLVSLSMFKNLRLIHGRQLLNGKYALSVFENQNLAQLWNLTDGFNITHGTIQFHNNPRLCYQIIMDMVGRIGLLNETTEHDVSKYSNGNKAVCDELEISLWLTHITDETAVFHWDEFDTAMMDHRMFLGYQLYYRPVESEDVNIFDGRDACHDNWQMRFFESNERGALVTDLKPYTLYAFYLTTLMVSSPGARGGMSKIVYHWTNFRHPSQPRIRKLESPSPYTITLEWEPPVHPNGEVTHYMISYVGKRDALPKERNYCDEPPTYGSASDKPFGENSVNAFKALWSDPTGTSSTSDTCSAYQCCQCLSPAVSNSTTKMAPDQQVVSEQREKAAFENAVHDIVFISSWRKKRSLQSELSGQTAQEHNLTSFTLRHLEYENRYLKAVVINVTGLNYTLTNLHHFTSYEIRIWACQNVSVPENYCSQQEALKTKRTQMIKWKDRINASSIHIVNETTSPPNVRYVQWEEPDDPNGIIVGFKIEYFNLDSSTEQSKVECMTQRDYLRRGGFVLTDLTPGNWSLRIATLSLAQRAGWSDRFYFVIPEPYKFSSTLVICIAVVCSLAVTAVVAVLSISIYRRNFRKKLPEYLMNVFSANPEYISQLEVYKPDEWELKREDIELLHEIGRGTFGTVYAGMGKKIRSHCGVVFGECAVKTVSERASIYDRWHFLIEASVMKQFNVAHIVKLYGVVSEGQPALVVMEMMHKGNLKDYLRSRRPNAEENVDGLSPPTLKESLQWAGEIADGMAYLEVLKFCHRDLAARNCMVTATGSCKIGDFGMARDVYVKDYYRPTGRRLMPVRWMSPEALKDATFTSKSDTWSYGVVLWEIATLASQPYAGLSNEDVIRFVVDTRRIMEMPTGCPPRLYNMMTLCWNYDSKDRPTFAELLAMLLPDMNDHFRLESYFCNQRGKESRSHWHNEQMTNRLSAPQPFNQHRPSLSKKNSEPPGSDNEFQEPICQHNRRPGSGSSVNSPVARTRKASISEPICLAMAYSSPVEEKIGRRMDEVIEEIPIDRRPSNEKLLTDPISVSQIGGLGDL